MLVWSISFFSSWQATRTQRLHLSHRPEPRPTVAKSWFIYLLRNGLLIELRYQLRQSSKWAWPFVMENNEHCGGRIASYCVCRSLSVLDLYHPEADEFQHSSKDTHLKIRSVVLCEVANRQTDKQTPGKFSLLRGAYNTQLFKLYKRLTEVQRNYQHDKNAI